MGLPMWPRAGAGSIMEETTPIVLWIEGRRRRQAPNLMAKVAKRGFNVIRVRTGKEAFERMDALRPDVVVINAPSIGSSGTRLVRKFRTLYPRTPIILFHATDSSPKNVPNDVDLLPASVSARRLLGRLRRLTHRTPSHNCIQVGPFRLDVEQRRLFVHGTVHELTPKLARLMHVLMQHAGYSISRETLFREVWQTDFTDDTRTLDVHISWLRRVIEPNPRRPRYLRTLRGRGYILDISPDDGGLPRAQPCHREPSHPEEDGR